MHEIPIAATGKLLAFAEARMIALPDFHLARRMAGRLETDDDVLLACALAVRELRHGSVCLTLAEAHELKVDAELDDGQEADDVELDWPDPARWAQKVGASAIVGEGLPFTFVDGRLYLTRFYREEQQVARALEVRRSLPVADDLSPLPAVDGVADEAQDAAVAAALRHMTAVVTGGPGTGKTTTVVRILNSLAQHNPEKYRIALAAPTGKAARQLSDSVSRHLDERVPVPFSGTLHALLGKRVRGSDAAFHSGNPLPYDVVVVDETSMVSLEHMGSLLDALSPTTRLVLVGDPNQLRSVEAGAVLADIVANPALTQPGSVVELRTNHRSEQDISALAAAVDAGDVEQAMAIIEESESITWHEFEGHGIEQLPVFRDDVLTTAEAVVGAARDGDAEAALRAMERHRVLCAHRLGKFGVQGWARAARDVVASRLPDYGQRERYVGQPLLLTHNTELFRNGDVAVIVEIDGALLAAIDQGGAPRIVTPVLLDSAADLHAMTIHKAQGGQYDTVTVVLPPAGSPLATRELVYTAITRARSAVRIYGTREAFEEALRTRARRASGLAVSS